MKTLMFWLGLIGLFALSVYVEEVGWFVLGIAAFIGASIGGRQ